MVKCEFLIRSVKNGSYLNDIVKHKAMFPSFGDIQWVPKIYCTYFFNDVNLDYFNLYDKELFFIIDISILKYENFLICNRWDYGNCTKPGNEKKILLKGSATVENKIKVYYTLYIQYYILYNIINKLKNIYFI